MSEHTIYRITTFFKRKPGISEEDFNYHWEKIHAPLVAPWAIKHGILQYTQFFTPTSLRLKISTGARDLPSGSGTLDYDGGVDWYVNSYEDYEAAFKDEYYLKVIEPDEWNFVDKGSGKEIAGAVSTVGVSRDIVKEGKSLVKEVVWNEG